MTDTRECAVAAWVYHCRVSGHAPRDYIGRAYPGYGRFVMDESLAREVERRLRRALK